ncbi:MAG TPA: D-alanyl-D-alanine endopeptidase [Casimicrobiaceae bacterium]|jgi:D-alanyl-D-alanine endopeptidase (penicillin-binding protein 7)
MRTSLTIVFAALIGFAHAATAAVEGVLPAVPQPMTTLDAAKLKLASANALVFDTDAGQAIYSKGADAVTPIASVTKLMTAMVILDGAQPMDEMLSVDIGDIDLLKGSHSRLRLGSELSRHDMLRLALMASENRAASSLARHYPGGTQAFVAAMNEKARSLGMTHTYFNDPTGLSSENVATAHDLARMVQAAADYPLIREFTTTPSHYVEVQPTGQLIGFNNTNSLVKSGSWDIQLSKTGFIREAGKCLVMLATIASRPVVIVLLDSYGRLTRIGDANRVKHWLETGEAMPTAVAARAPAKVRRGRTIPTRG